MYPLESIHQNISENEPLRHKYVPTGKEVLIEVIWCTFSIHETLVYYFPRGQYCGQIQIIFNQTGQCLFNNKPCQLGIIKYLNGGSITSLGSVVMGIHDMISVTQVHLSLAHLHYPDIKWQFHHCPRFPNRSSLFLKSCLFLEIHICHQWKLPWENVRVF